MKCCPKYDSSARGVPGEAISVVASRLPAAAAAPKRVATNTRPLPRNTVERNLSSPGPTCARTAPMNHRKKMPAKGMRASAVCTPLREDRLSGEPVSAPSPLGMEARTRTMAAPISTANAIPTSPAARGVRSAWAFIAMKGSSLVDSRDRLIPGSTGADDHATRGGPRG